MNTQLKQMGNRVPELLWKLKTVTRWKIYVETGTSLFGWKNYFESDARTTVCVLFAQRWNNDWFAQLNSIFVTSGIFRFAFCYRTTKLYVECNPLYCMCWMGWSMEYCWYTVQYGTDRIYIIYIVIYSLSPLEE